MQYSCSVLTLGLEVWVWLKKLFGKKYKNTKKGIENFQSRKWKMGRFISCVHPELDSQSRPTETALVKEGRLADHLAPAKALPPKCFLAQWFFQFYFWFDFSVWSSDWISLMQGAVATRRLIGPYPFLSIHSLSNEFKAFNLNKRRLGFRLKQSVCASTSIFLTLFSPAAVLSALLNWKPSEHPTAGIQALAL